MYPLTNSTAPAVTTPITDTRARAALVLRRLKCAGSRSHPSTLLTVAVAHDVEFPDEVVLSFPHASDRLELEPGSRAISQVGDDHPRAPRIAEGEQPRRDQ